MGKGPGNELLEIWVKLSAMRKKLIYSYFRECSNMKWQNGATVSLDSALVNLNSPQMSLSQTRLRLVLNNS